MSKFCENCGAEMEDNEVICKNCNTPVDGAPKKETVAEPQQATASTATSAGSDKKKLAIIGGCAAAFVVAIIILIVSLVSGRYKSPIKKYVKGLNKCDADTYAAAYPDFTKTAESTKDKTLTDRKKNYEKTYGDNVKFKVDVLKKTKIEKKDLEKVKDAIKDKYKESVKVTKGFKVKVKQTIKGKKDYDYTTNDVYVYKIDGKWYLLNIDPEDLD